MADTREQTESDERGMEQARTGSAGPSERSGAARRRRRPLLIVVGIVVAVVVYALAFEQTEVELSQITSETRQRSLENILRNLARPDLVTYDTTEEFTTLEVAIPCGPPLATNPQLTAEPACGEPGDTITITGTGFQPREQVDLIFIPDSDFAVELRLMSVNADPDGNIAAELTLPDRTSEEPQELRAVTREPIGTWGNRVEVYTDANGNGVEDDPILGDGGRHRFTLAGNPDIPAVALISPANEATQFVTVGEGFEAINGVARGETALPLGEIESTSDLQITSLTSSGGEVEVELEGRAGFDMSNWRAAVYDGATGEAGATNYISDTIQLSPRISEHAIITLDKILETVFLALVATTAGLLLAVPLSFISARNLMRDISITVTNLGLILIAAPLGGFIGVQAAGAVQSLVNRVGESSLTQVIALVMATAISLWLMRTALPPTEDEIPTPGERVRRGLLQLVAGALGLVAILIGAALFQNIGASIRANLGWFGFLGSFFSSVGEVLEVAFTVMTALAVGALLAHLASRLGYAIRKKAAAEAVRILDFLLSAAAGALWAVIVGQIIDWFYQIGSVQTVVVIPAVVGAVLGVAVAIRGMRRNEVRIGLSIYYASRTVFNTLRSIEPLIMAIVFVVWVGAGPFAGSLALALHTAAALAKLYSEQVESISPGPIEAVRATGANRLQTIVYSVVPQIIPPYISFTMYRWDINVRMSTILGFVGGGGIGSILQQNINLLQYRAAAVQMLAIAIVVATMDWASSRMRERYV